VLTVDLPTAFAYVPGSTTGVTTVDPRTGVEPDYEPDPETDGVIRQTWEGEFTIPARSEVTLRFRVMGAFGPFIFLMIIGAIVFIIWSIRNMKRGFMQNESALHSELERLKRKPVKLDGTFKETPISCYDNTWQMTVETLIKTASVVLMDLRGFSEKTKVANLK
jgi:hypothetical protein